MEHGVLDRADCGACHRPATPARRLPGLGTAERGGEPVPRVNRDESGTAQRGFPERERQGPGGVVRIADADDHLAADGARLLPVTEVPEVGTSGRDGSTGPGDTLESGR